LLKEGESGFHKYIINEKNEFNEISKKFSDVEALLNRLEKIMNLIKQRRQQKHPLDSDLDDSFVLFQQGAFQTLNSMLFLTISKTHTDIKSEKDVRILFEKYLELSERLYVITKPMKGLFDMLDRTWEAILNKSKSAPPDKKIPKSKSEIKKHISKLDKEIPVLQTEMEIHKMKIGFAEMMISKLQEIYDFVSNE
jgi:hypothetical protein